MLRTKPINFYLARQSYKHLFILFIYDSKSKITRIDGFRKESPISRKHINCQGFGLLTESLFDPIFITIG